MKAFFLFALLTISQYTFCQNVLDSIVSEELDTPVYKSVQNMPYLSDFKGGLSGFITKNVEYPFVAAQNNIEGTVLVGFIVNEDSTLSDFHIRKGVTPELNAEALRVVKQIPKVVPGSIDGKNVKVIVALPVDFTFPVYDSAKGIYKVVDHLPEFPGGDRSLISFLNNNIEYPASSFENHIEGVVIVAFNVNEDGRVSDFKIRKGVSRDLNAEALRIVKMFPRLRPARLDETNVRVTMSVSIKFRISNPYGPDHVYDDRPVLEPFVWPYPFKYTPK